MTKARKHHTWAQTTWKCWLLEIQRYRYSHTTPRCNDTGEHYRDNNKYYVHTSRVASTIWRKAFSILTSCYRVENRFSSALYTQQCRLKRIPLTKEIENSEIVFLRLSQSWLRFLQKWEHLIFLNKYVTELSSWQSWTISIAEKLASNSAISVW